MLEFRQNSNNSFRVYITNEIGDIVLGELEKTSAGFYWFVCGSKCLYASELEDIANKLKELNATG